MKKIITSIITFTIIFSSLSSTFAEEWYIERLLDLNYWVEKATINLSELNYYKFEKTSYIRVYNEFKTIDKILRSEFIKKYENWEYDYYQINWIITNYNNFIYYLNKFFYYLKLKEKGYKYTELDSAIINSHTNMRRFYRHVKNNAKIKKVLEY